MTGNVAVISMPAPAVLRDRIEIREAHEGDNEALLALTRATPMGGTISLRIDRDPDFFALLRLRGEWKVFVAELRREIIGCVSVAFRSAYISGHPETVAYIGDVKVHPRYSGTRVGLRLSHFGEAYIRSTHTGFCFGVVAEGNHRIMPFLKGRLGMTEWVPLGRFVVDELIPSPFKGRKGRYLVEPARVEDLPRIRELLDGFHRSRQFAPRLSDDELARALSGNFEAPFSRMFVARCGRNIVATLALCDTRTVKRNVLINAPRSLRATLTLLRMAAAPFPGFSIPRIGDPVRVLYARYMACDDAHRAALQALVGVARAEAFSNRYSFVAVGLHERDPLRCMTRRVPKLRFSSLAFATSASAGRLGALSSGIPFEDFALV